MNSLGKISQWFRKLSLFLVSNSISDPLEEDSLSDEIVLQFTKARNHA
jgi:hypothetical protein